MNEVLLRFESEVATNGARKSFVDRVGSAGQLTESSDGAGAFEHCGHQRTGGDELQQARVERALGVFCVVATSHLFGSYTEFECCNCQAFALDTAEDFSYVSTGNGVGLDQYEGALSHSGQPKWSVPLAGKQALVHPALDVSLQVDEVSPDDPEGDRHTGNRRVDEESE